MSEPKYIKIFDLYVRGFSAREIARYVYGREDAANRVRRMIHYARRKVTALPVPLLSETVKQRGSRLETKLWNNPDKVIDIKKRVRKPEDRQLITHEQLIYYLLSRLGFKVMSPENGDGQALPLQVLQAFLRALRGLNALLEERQ